MAYQNLKQGGNPPQYGGQYPQQQQSGQPQRSPSHTKLVIGVAVVLLIVVVVVFVLFGPGEEETTRSSPQRQVQEPEQVSPMAETGGLKFDKFVFASRINDDFTYEPKTDKTYYTINPIYIYIEPKGFRKVEAEDGWQVDIVEDIEVRGPDGRIVPYLTIPGVVKVTSSETGEVAIRNKLELGSGAEEGSYEVTVTLKDLMLGDEVTRKESFNTRILVAGTDAPDAIQG